MNRNHSISVDVISEGGVEEVKLWLSPEEKYYLFLPGYADLSQVQIRRNLLGPIYLDNKRVTRQMPLGEFPMNEEITLIHDPCFGYQWNELTIVQSANLPTMYIDVKSGNMDYIHQQKGNKEAGTMRLYSADGRLEAAAMVDSLQGRGNSTWQWQNKKPYNLSLSTETDILGMGAASRWILLADAFDPSCLRNKITYDLAKKAQMPYSPDCQWVDLYLNGEYAGIYLLSERNEIRLNRVDIPETSSFLVSWESDERLIEQNYPHVTTERGTAIRIHQSALSQEKIQSIWQSAENAIFAEDGVDPISGKHWQELIDMDSWAKLFLIDEISADFDGGKISEFFYYQETDGIGKIYGGPVWDKDNTFGLDHWSITPPNCLVASRTRIVEGKNQRMFSGLYEKEAFSSRVAEIYETTFLPLLKELYAAGIEDYANQIAQAAQLNELRWNLEYDPEENFRIRDFLGERMAFLNAYWIQKEQFQLVNIVDTIEYVEGSFAVRPGEHIPALPEYDSNQGIFAWYYSESGEPFDVNQPIWENVDIVLKKIG